MIQVGLPDRFLHPQIFLAELHSSLQTTGPTVLALEKIKKKNDIANAFLSLMKSLTLYLDANVSDGDGVRFRRTRMPRNNYTTAQKTT
jgi:hypothetical protein